MRFFSGTAAGMATLLCLAGLTNAGVVNRAENTVTGISETAINAFFFTANIFSTTLIKWSNLPLTPPPLLSCSTRTSPRLSSIDRFMALTLLRGAARPVAWSVAPGPAGRLLARAAEYVPLQMIRISTRPTWVAGQAFREMCQMVDLLT